MSTSIIKLHPDSVEQEKKNIAHNRTVLMQLEDMVAGYFNTIDRTNGEFSGDLSGTCIQVKELAQTLTL